MTPMNRLESPTISRPDLSAAIAAIPLNAVMSREVLVVGPQDPVVEVWQRMHDVATSMAVVCEGTRVADLRVDLPHNRDLTWMQRQAPASDLGGRQPDEDPIGRGDPGG